MLDLVTLVAILGACISVGGAVFSLLFSRRTSDAELKTDVQELALLVERLAKAQRREKMARVRSAAKDNEHHSDQPPLDFPADPKTALRQRLAAITRG